MMDSAQQGRWPWTRTRCSGRAGHRHQQKRRVIEAISSAQSMARSIMRQRAARDFGTANIVDSVVAAIDALRDTTGS